MALTRTEFLNNLLMALLYEEEAILRSYKEWMNRIEHEEVREFLSEMVDEAAHHKGEILDIIEEIEAEELGKRTVTPEGPS
ncbi:MAG: hypothetical protein R3185_09270 [Candidatus Thermoplasmatota archaeon]|nr:hypothetical protein [Candidatus Thermoplasmatota archaeon]